MTATCKDDIEGTATVVVSLCAIINALTEWGTWKDRLSAVVERLAVLHDADWFLLHDGTAAPGFPPIGDYVSPPMGSMWTQLFRQIDKRLNGASQGWSPDWFIKTPNAHRFSEYHAVLDDMRTALGEDAALQLFDGEPRLRMPRHIYTAGDLAELLTAEAIKAQSFATFVSHDLVGRLALSLDAVARVFPELETFDQTRREPAKVIALESAKDVEAKAQRLAAIFKRPKKKADKWTPASEEEVRRQITELTGLGVTTKKACIMVADAWNAGLAADDPERVSHQSIATHWRGRAKPLDDAKRAIKDKRQA